MKRAQQKRAGVIAAVAGATVMSLFSPAARATSYTWSSTAAGTYDWNAPANWGGVGFPNAITDIANLNVALSGNVNINVPDSVGATAVTRTLVNNLTGSSVLNIGKVSSVATATPTANIANILQLSNANNSATTQWGTINLNGVISNGVPVGGFNVTTQVLFGAGGSNSANTIATININAANTFSGGARLFR